MTRTEDENISLERRQEIASETGADILVSIHGNASPNRKAEGAEVFYLSRESVVREANRDNLRLSEASDLDRTLADLNHEEGMMLSARLASRVAQGINAGSPVKMHRVMQAGFQVLKLNGIPAVLVEVGFLTNASEAKTLADGRFPDRMAESLAGAILRFQRAELAAPPSRAFGARGVKG